ncbi:MAG: Ribosomal RNA small subunit methyltransferase I [Clostridiales bacterium 38_11]|nr:MAG: Ribosomal RNA small subunit methyltransferase I [Clostridiales bacterium 38_11]HBH12291.1 16S rRNA (cytidine(1402)-2'-O)-methyltransferase [Clostridiales bacterium]
MDGKLYVCATPIGNLEDITLRVLRVLKEVDFIAAEDTRHTIKLLNHYETKNRLISYHEHNEKKRSEQIIEKLLSGESCALVSDAGMPGISDPGEFIIREAIKNNIEIIVLPGATAFVPAIVLSGFDTDKFVFEGFLPSKKGEKRKALEKLVDEERTIIFYESPHRLTDTLKAMIKAFGKRQVSVSREITKKFEETVRGDLEEVLTFFEAKDIKGEFVLVVKGSEESLPEASIDMDKALRELIDDGMTKKDAVNHLVKTYRLNKNDVYQKSLKL